MTDMIARWLARAFLVGVLAAVVLFLCLADVRAENCRRVTTVVSPVVTTHAPVVSYTGNLHAQQLLVPHVQPVAVNPDFYFSVGDEYRQLAFAKLIAQEYAKLMTQPQQAQPPVVPMPPASPGIVQQGVEAPAGKQFMAMPADPKVPRLECSPVKTNLPAGFYKLVETKCAACHTSGKGKIALDLSDLDALSTFPISTRDRMFRSVSNGRMPKGGTVTQDELNLFNAYSALAEQAVFGTPMPDKK